jgi:hypothetical protein
MCATKGRLGKEGRQLWKRILSDLQDTRPVSPLCSPQGRAKSEIQPNSAQHKPHRCSMAACAVLSMVFWPPVAHTVACTLSGELCKRCPSAPAHPSCSSASPVQPAVHLDFDLAALYGLLGPLTRSPRPAEPTARESWRSCERLGASMYCRWWRCTSPLRRRSKVLSSHRFCGGSGYSLALKSEATAPSCLGTCLLPRSRRRSTGSADAACVSELVTRAEADSSSGA